MTKRHLAVGIGVALGAAVILVAIGSRADASERVTSNVATVAVAEPGQACSGNSELADIVGTDGCIRFPINFQTELTHIGSWGIPGDAGGIHEVYTQLSSVEAYQANGTFPDGAVLVKSVRNAAHETLTTGDAHRGTDQNVWFVLVKDSQNRFAASNPIWGDGWGWALFKAPDKVTQTATDYKSDCLGCHVPRKDNDWLYTEGYPILDGR